jgi:ribosomal protein S18 acetylase RimI-like enzyme
MFQLVPTDVGIRLDEKLAERGYRVDAPVSIQTAQAETLVGVPGAPGAVISNSATPSADYLHVVVERGRYQSAAVIYGALLARLGSGARYFSARLDGAPAAALLGVAQGSHWGLFGMHTLAEFRRRGLGRALLEAAARKAVQAGASTLYLQVERDNPAALSFYQNAGFVERYGYHYRRLDRTGP